MSALRPTATHLDILVFWWFLGFFLFYFSLYFCLFPSVTEISPRDLSAQASAAFQLHSLGTNTTQSLPLSGTAPGTHSALTPKPWKAGKFNFFFFGGEEGLPTWTDEDVFHGEHGCNGKQEILTVQGSSFDQSTGQVGREGKLHQEFPQSCHVASPYTRRKK